MSEEGASAESTATKSRRSPPLSLSLSIAPTINPRNFRLLLHSPSPMLPPPAAPPLLHSPSPTLPTAAAAEPKPASPPPMSLRLLRPPIQFALPSITSLLPSLLFFTSLRSLLPTRRPAPPPSSPPAAPPAGCALPRFRPYVAKTPWHGGVRALLSGLFPRYGHYCGPNWSSGKAAGSLLWDRRPIDWLDFCCYCHDIGYDSHDQSKLLSADLHFLSCLERPRMATKGGAVDSLIYRAMCITGLRYILIPYRTQLVRLQSGGGGFSLQDVFGNLIGRRNAGNTIIRHT